MFSKALNIVGMYIKSDTTNLDIRSYFGSTSQASSDAKADSDSEDHGTDSSDPESSPSPPPSKKVCKSSKNKRYHCSVSTKRKYSKSWEKDFSWLYYDEDSDGAFCKICKQSGISGLQRTGAGGVWVTKPFKNWKKAVEKMKAHSRSDSHSHATQAMLAAKRAVVDGTVVQQLQNVEAHKRAQNRAAMKCLHPSHSFSYKRTCCTFYQI